MLPIKIKENVYWVGAIDWELRNFHGYMTQRGSSYNAYLVLGEKNVLIDNVKVGLCDQMFARIKRLISLDKIDAVIQNHVEMDHSGSLKKVMEMNPTTKIYASPNGEKGLKLHYKEDWDFEVVGNLAEFEIGGRHYQFVHTPMVHWPDNMVTYYQEGKILFSNDAFGQHISSTERFDDEMPLDIVLEEAKKYYANIVLPYGEQVKRVLPTVEKLDIDTIAPSHGLIWRENIPRIISEYKQWSDNQTEEKAVIVYDSMWRSTEMIAYAIHNAFTLKGIPAKLFNLQNNHISDIMTPLLTAKYICVGSPTLNNNIMPTVSAFLTYMKGLLPKKRVGLAFGSYGWGGQSVGIVEDILKSCKFEMLPSVREQYVPTEKKLAEITEIVMNSLR